MTRTMRTRWICLGIAGALLVVRLATSPVVFRVPFFYGEHSDQPRFVLLNPFRSRAPEKVANQALLSIMSGHCDETLASASDMMEPERNGGICSLFRKFPLKYWDLRNRTDSADECRLIYWYDGDPVVDVYVRKVNGRWKFVWINYVT